jgi:hypothetical protein
VTNTTIGSAAWNATQADYVTALAHTASATRALYPITSQVQDGALLWGGTAGGTADALTITLTPAITAYVTGQVFQFVASAANATTTPTINVNSLGAKSIKRQNGATIQPGDIPAGALLQASYNGTDFLLTSTTAVQASSFAPLWGGTAGGTADALTITLTPAITAYTTGRILQFISSAANVTTTPTLNINALGVKTIKRQNGAAIQPGDIPAGSLVQVAYNGTDFLLTSVTAVQERALVWGGTAGGTADALTITLTPAITAYVTGQVFQFTSSAANATTTPTININAVGIKTIKRQNGATIQPGDIPASSLVQIAYNGVDFLLTGVTAVQASSLGALWGGTAGGTADALTITLTPAITAYTTGQIFQFTSSAPNATATPTLNINSVGVRTIKRQSGAAMQAGDISAGALVQVAYNGTDFLLTGVTAGQASSLGVVPYSGRTSNTLLGAADRSYLIDITSGTFTQTFGACSALGSGWWLYLSNSGTGDITLDPNGAETIDGLATFIMYPGEARFIQCDGTALRSLVVRPFDRYFTASGTFTKPPGYSQFGARAWSGGQSGGLSSSGAFGGVGGGCGDFIILASALGAAATVTIGAGGSARTTSGSGNIGGNTTLGSVLTVFAGDGNSGGSIQSGLSTGGSAARGAAVGYEGATRAASSAVSSIYGGAAPQPTFLGTSGSSVFGGAAGGSVDGSSVLLSPGVSTYGGNGGAASAASSGTAGSQPGGGGGATRTGTASGAGGDGAMRIWGLT